jgi:flagella basal body P-ring formation protein FlgA
VLIAKVNCSAQAQTNSVDKPSTATVAEQPALPKRLPMIAPDYVAPEKALPSLERVGVNDADALALTLNEAIRLALENNNDILASRIDVEMAEHDLTASRGAYDPKTLLGKLFRKNFNPGRFIPRRQQQRFTED